MCSQNCRAELKRPFTCSDEFAKIYERVKIPTLLLNHITGYTNYPLIAMYVYDNEVGIRSASPWTTGNRYNHARVHDPTLSTVTPGQTNNVLKDIKDGIHRRWQFPVTITACKVFMNAILSSRATFITHPDLSVALQAGPASPVLDYITGFGSVFGIFGWATIKTSLDRMYTVLFGAPAPGPQCITRERRRSSTSLAPQRCHGNRNSISRHSTVSAGSTRWSMQPWCDGPMVNRGHGTQPDPWMLDPELRYHIQHCPCPCNHMGYGNFLDYQVTGFLPSYSFHKYKFFFNLCSRLSLVKKFDTLLR